MKVLILLTYFNRPVLVRNALESLAANRHTDWELIFGDDGSDHPGEPICREILSNHLAQIQFINSGTSLEEKFTEGISIGRFANRLIAESDAELVITLCDDDALTSDYLASISAFFESHSAQYAYSHLSIFNPLFEKPGVLRLSHRYNKHTSPMNPAGVFDASQVAFRSSTVRDHNCRYPETTCATGKPWLLNLDAGLFQSLFDKFGPAPYTGLVAQHKGVHEYQLVWHKNTGRIGLENYVKKCGQLAGKTL